MTISESTAPAAARIQALLGRPEYVRLFDAIRRRLEDDGEAARSVALPPLDEEERTALAGILAWRALPRPGERLELARLDLALRESAAAAPLAEVLQALGGPLRDRRKERSERSDARHDLWLAGEELVPPEHRPWLDWLRSSGALARAARAAAKEPLALLTEAVRVVERLPCGGELLGVLAASATGDPHALDAGQPLGGLVLRAATTMLGRAEVPSSAEERRRLWREVGVDCDALSADVLVVGLRIGGEGRLARHLRESAEDGEPRRVTLRELSRAAFTFAPSAPLFVCENPAVVEAAAGVLGRRCPALVCVEGVPSTAAMELLRRLSPGSRVRVQADLDWAGLRIASAIMAATEGVPWRLGVEDFREAVDAGGAGPRLAGSTVPSPWDPALSTAMVRAGVSVPEEALLPRLLEDLAQVSPGSPPVEGT